MTVGIPADRHRIRGQQAALQQNGQSNSQSSMVFRPQGADDRVIRKALVAPPVRKSCEMIHLLPMKRCAGKVEPGRYAQR